MAVEVDPLAFQKGFQATQNLYDTARQNRLADLAFGQKQQELAQQNALAGVVGDVANYDQAGNLKREALPQIAQASPGSLPQYQKVISEQQAQQAAQQKAQRDQLMAQFDWADKNLAGVQNQAQYDEFRTRAAQVYPDVAARLPAQFDAAAIQANRMKMIPVVDQWKAEQEAERFKETQRHNRALEENASGTLGVARDRLTYDQNAPKGQVVQTDQGTLLVDPRTGTSRPVMGADNQPAQKPGKEIPASVNKSIIENQQNLSKIDTAIKSIQDNPDALGLVNMIPGAETVRQYTGTPEEITTRAGVADIGSLILHDRSGAAVTVSEMPRLKPFIPTASDSPKAALKKLERFKELYQQEADLLAETYSKEQGYKPSPVLTQNQAAKSAAGSPPKISSKAEMDALPSGSLFVAPDGTTRRKP